MANRVQRRIVFQRPDSREGRRTMRKKERKRERVTTTNPVGIKSLEKSRCMKETWKDFYCLGSVSSEENWGGGVARERGCDESGGGSFFFFFSFQIKTWLWFGPFIRIRTVRLIIAANRSRIFINDTSCCFQLVCNLILTIFFILLLIDENISRGKTNFHPIVCTTILNA